MTVWPVKWLRKIQYISTGFSATTSLRTSSSRILFFSSFVVCVFVFAVSTTNFPHPFKQIRKRSLHDTILKAPLDFKQGVTLRMPFEAECIGDLIFRIGQNQSEGTVVVTEATLDKRHVSEKKFRRHRPNVKFFRRFSVHLSVDEEFLPALVGEKYWHRAEDEHLLNFSEETARLTSFRRDGGHGDPTLNNDLHFALDYALLLRCALPFKRRKHKVCAWNFVVSVWPSDARASEQNFLRLLEEARARNDLLSLRVVFKRITDEDKNAGETFVVQPKLALGCIDGWNFDKHLSWLADEEKTSSGDWDCDESNSSLIMVGSPLSGVKRSETGAIEAAHFANRALRGVVQFHTVAISFVVRHTISEMEYVCSQEAKLSKSSWRSSRKFEHYRDCLAAHHERNAQDMQHFRNTIDTQLGKLGVGAVDRRRVVVSSYCRLGSDFQGSEKQSPCSRMRADGQVVWGSIGMSQFGHRHKWIAVMDLDEFFGWDPRDGADYFGRKQEATEWFDDVQKEFRGRETFKFGWMYTIVESVDMVPLVSKAVVDGVAMRLEVVDVNGVPTGQIAVDNFLQENGKSVSRCTRGLRPHVHNAIVLSDEYDLNSGTKSTPVNTTATRLRVWHARIGSKFRGEPRCMLRFDRTAAGQ